MLCEKIKKKRTSAEVLSAVIRRLPPSIVREIEQIALSRHDYPDALSEIRIRRFGRCSLVLSGENIPLFSSVTSMQIDEIFDSVIGGSLYAHTRDLRDGFVSIENGIRVGICGMLGDGKNIPTVIDSLVFRIPIGKCEYSDALLTEWKRPGTTGMLIYSLPGAGKTSALRVLAGAIGRELSRRVVVVDERCEFIASEYSDAMVDILRAYTKPHGIEIALRTLCAEVIMVDEIGNADEAEALLRVGRGGVPMIATAHAGCFDEVVSKEGIAPLIKEGYFNRFIRLFTSGGCFGYEIESVV